MKKTGILIVLLVLVLLVQRPMAWPALLALVVIFCVKTVGVLLVTALLIVPAATARNLAESSGKMFWISILTGICSGVAGLLISAQDWAGTAAGATIVLCACLFFVISLGICFIRKWFRS